MRFASVLLLAALAASAQRIPGRYIVELNTVPVAEHVARAGKSRDMRTADVYAYRASIHAEQQQVRQSIEQRGAKVRDGVDTVANALFVEVSDADAARLAQLPGVKRVVPERMLRMSLDRAVALHKVVDVWNQIGIDKAGAGMKIAIIDTGVDITHPGFQDSSLAVPDSFPRVNQSIDTAFTNNKVIVARSYVYLLSSFDPDMSAQDHVGHGTALAMTAAGVQNAGPLATITGVAPKAYIGSYKVFGTPGFNDNASDSAILKAMDDAVADGMDVINLSLGYVLAPRVADDVDVQAIERASQAGVVVVVAAGNDGPDPNTISSPGTAPSAIAVGGTTNDRTFGTSVQLAGLDAMVALPGSGPTPASAVVGPLADVSTVDPTGQACSTLPPGSLSGSVALILRGSCTFESKLNNVQAAGAIGGIVYAAADSPDAIFMNVGAAPLPAEMVSNPDGLALKQAVASASGGSVTLSFTVAAVPQKANRVVDFSATGPGPEGSIKPDVVAVGANFYTATQTLDFNGDMYDPSGYILVDGTSFSTPLTAGTVALLKGARPGLTVDQYRSLIVNSAGTAYSTTGDTATIQQTGAGLLDAYAALKSTIAAAPVSLSFGAAQGDTTVSRTLTVTNLGPVSDTFTVAVKPRVDGVAPVPGTNSVQLNPGASVDIPVTLTAAGLAPGAYDGYVLITSQANGGTSKVAYWFGETSTTPVRFSVLDGTFSARRSSVLTDAVLFRFTDVSGMPVTGTTPTVTVQSGNGTVRNINNYDSDVPGLFSIDVQLGPARGTNVFRIQMGDVFADVAISGL